MIKWRAMGNLFPNDPEYPDYRPMPSLKADMTKAGCVTSFALAVGLAPLCPVQHLRVSIHEHEHVPHHEFVDTQPVISMSAFVSSSSSGDPTTWQNSSMFDAADVAIRGHRALRDAQTRIAGMSSTSSAAVLTTGSIGLDWLPSTRITR